ncbi:MAG: hypothetical protein KF847_13355 [Pirellulales bacterium]|nr:hypothetical protein [Pirellulales bacterium]
MSQATRGFASIADLATLEKNWEQTQLGQLMHDPAMRPFVEDVKRQMQRKLSGMQEKLGLTFDDLRDVAAGEIGMGVVERKGDRAALAVTVDVTGRREAADAMLAKIDSDLAKRNATKSTAASGGVTLTIYRIPSRRDGDVAHDAIFFIENDLLCGVDNRAEADAMIARIKGQGSDSLATVESYKQTMRRCAAEARSLAPEVRWFADPFGYARAARSLAKPGERPAGKDYVEILRSQGFDAVQGAGGYVNLLVAGTYEVVHRTAVYAPPIPGEKDKYRLAMRMLQFPNGGELQPQPWIPRGLASYRTFNMDLKNAFAHVDTLFDAIAGYENAFADVIEGLRKDPYGPQVDVEQDFVAYLGNRVSLVTDYNVPITTKSERFLFAVEVKDEAKVADAVNRFMKADPNAFHRDFEGKSIWEIAEPKNDVPELEIEIGGFEPLGPESGDANDANQKHAPASAVCVTDGHLLIASHMNFLQEILSVRNQQEALVGSGDFHQVDAALNQLIDDPVCARCFVRTDEAYRPTYELLRQGKMPESETLLGRFLNRLLTPPEDEEEGRLRQQKIDGRELPSFEMVRRYFSPAGTLVRADDDGWFVVGATLTKQPAQARANAGTSAVETTVR